MITKEYVMAVLCTPLSFKEILHTERTKNVVILRRVEYDQRMNYFSGGGVYGLASSPLKLMFIFGSADAIIVTNPEDRQEVQRRLNLSGHGAYA